MSLPSFILVMAVSPRGTFRRCGLQFDRSWRPLQIGDVATPAAAVPVITPEMLALIELDANPRPALTRATTGREKQGELPQGELVPNKREQLAPPMLAVRPASEHEVQEFLSQQAYPSDPTAELAEAKRTNAELEARLMRLEMGVRDAGDAALAAKDAELAEAKRTNAELADRMAKLEQIVAAATAPKPGDGTTKTDDGKVASKK